MKLIMAVVLVSAAISAVAVLNGCGRHSTVVGQPVTETVPTPIGNIMAHPELFAGKTVRVEGVLTDECPAGGWFFLKDGTGVIYVNLHPANLAIPQMRGGKLVAQGTVRTEGPQVEIIGEGVELK
jgi:hypothetical protein